MQVSPREEHPHHIGSAHDENVTGNFAPGKFKLRTAERGKRITDISQGQDNYKASPDDPIVSPTLVDACQGCSGLAPGNNEDSGG